MIVKYRLYLIVLFMLVLETVQCFWPIPAASILLIPAGILLVVCVPGALCVDILFPNSHLNGYARVALALALSAVVILTIPFVMSYMGIPFFRSNLVLGLDVVVIALMVGAFLRTTASRDNKSMVVAKSTLFTGLMCAAMFSVVVGIAEYNLHQFQPRFYVTNTLGKLTNFPYEIVKDHVYSIQLHIENPTTTDLDGVVEARTSSGSHLWSIPVKVRHKETWSKEFRLPSNRLGENETVEFILTVPNHPRFTRTLWLRYSVVLPQD